MPSKLSERIGGEMDYTLPGFDVTCVVGRVLFTEIGAITPTEAAFQLIAHHHASGVFQFPDEHGDIISVTVEYPEPRTQGVPIPKTASELRRERNGD